MTTDIEDLAKLGPKIINNGEYDDFMSAINDSIEESIDNTINFQVEELDFNGTNDNSTNDNSTNDNSTNDNNINHNGTNYNGNKYDST
jgi:hypothetical protein